MYTCKHHALYKPYPVSPGIKYDASPLNQTSCGEKHCIPTGFGGYFDLTGCDVRLTAGLLFYSHANLQEVYGLSLPNGFLNVDLKTASEP